MVLIVLGGAYRANSTLRSGRGNILNTFPFVGEFSLHHLRGENKREIPRELKLVRVLMAREDRDQNHTRA